MKAATDFFQVGGTLGEDAPSYIERLADQELLTALNELELCLVLAPRQMGKSSLMVHAISKLKEKGKRSGIVDLQLLGSQTDPELWFGDVVYQISRSLSLNIDVIRWWKDYSRIGPTQRFTTFIEDVLLKELNDEIIIFIDEIDSVLPLPFSDDFFTSIRSVYNARAINPELRRITFVLLGVTTPSSFIRDRSRTPFNIGKPITLKDFDQKLTGPFHEVLGPDSEILIKRIFYWTNGQPFLVQKLAAAVFSWPQDRRSVASIDEEVKRTYLECKIERDTHLKPIQDYLLAEPNQINRVLYIYRRVLKGKAVIENERSSVQNRLKLSGIVGAENERLTTRNRIYQTIFNVQWINAQTPGISRKLLVLFSQLPLYLGLWHWWEQVKEQPLLVILIFALYEICAFAFIFSNELWVKSEAAASQKLAGTIWAIVNNLAPGFRRRYKKQIITKHSTFNTKGLGIINTYALALDQVFIDLRILHGNPQKLNLDPIAKVKAADRKSIWDFLRSYKKGAESKVLAIIGPPGCGKTTLLQHVATTLAAGHHRRYGIQSYTPILLFLRDHIKTITQKEPPPLGKLLQDCFNDADMFPGLKPPKGWFDRELERGKCIVLLDGLDEVAETQQRSMVSMWIDSQINNYSNCSFVLTARPQGYRDAPLEKADVLEVQPFNDKQVQKFIENWYLANEIRASGDQDDFNIINRARRAASELLERLRAAPPLGALTVNPLLLTMIAMVHRYYGALPGSRVELYASICEVLLGRWHQSRGVIEELSTQQKLMIIRPLASYMMEHKLRDISMHKASLIIAEPLRQLMKKTGSAESFLNNLQASSGLLLEPEVGQWSFAHLTFQEFLTSAYWVEQKAVNRNWSELVSDSWWHETLRLYAAQSDASPIVQACLNNDDLSSLALAADCLEEARGLDPNLRHATELRVVAALESNDPAIRNFAAEVRLSRRLNSLQRIDEDREIDLDYLTCAEYQLFLNEKRAQGEYHQPDHWPNYIFSRGEALQPITGLRVEDAIAFCAWLTKRRGDNVHYRLPQLNEALEYPAKTANLGGWCSDGRDKFRLVGLDEERRQIIVQHLGSLSHLTLPSLDNLYGTYDNNNFSVILRDLIQSLDKASNLASNIENNQENSPRLANDLIHAINCAINLIFHLFRELNWLYDFSLPREHARDLGLVLMHDIDLNHEGTRAIDIAQKLDWTLSSDNPHDRIFNIKSAFFSRSRVAFHAQFGQAYNLDSILENTRDIARRLAYVFRSISDIVNSLNHILLPVAKADWDEVQRQIQVRQNFSDNVLRHLTKLLNNELTVISPETELPSHSDTSPFNYQVVVNQNLLRLYWWVQIVTARKKGLLPAWEGIRILRERVV